MKLQIAMDRADTALIVQIADEIHDLIDIFEVGTPVIMNEGMRPVEALKTKYPNLCVLADTKIIDGGALECEAACYAGADIVTVLALADNSTISEVVKVARQHARKVLADLICVEDIGKRARELVALGVDYVGVHTGVDQQKNGRTPLRDLNILTESIDSHKTAVAGGIHQETIKQYAALNPEIIIVGSALYHAKNKRAVILHMKECMRHGH